MQQQQLCVSQESQDETRVAVLPPLPPVEEHVRQPWLLLWILFGPYQYVLLFLFYKTLLKPQKMQQ